MSTLPDHETIERAYATPIDLVHKLPETTEARRAAHHLELAKRYTQETIERARILDRARSD